MKLYLYFETKHIFVPILDLFPLYVSLNNTRWQDFQKEGSDSRLEEVREYIHNKIHNAWEIINKTNSKYSQTLL